MPAPYKQQQQKARVNNCFNKLKNQNVSAVAAFVLNHI